DLAAPFFDVGEREAGGFHHRRDGEHRRVVRERALRRLPRREAQRNFFLLDLGERRYAERRTHSESDDVVGGKDRDRADRRRPPERPFALEGDHRRRLRVDPCERDFFIHNRLDLAEAIGRERETHTVLALRGRRRKRERQRIADARVGLERLLGRTRRLVRKRSIIHGGSELQQSLGALNL